jgi:hypothetical protein
MTDEKSEVLKIIEIRIKEAVENEKKDIEKQCVKLGDDAIARINGVYASIQHTIMELEIKDASLLEFYTKAGGRVRSLEVGNQSEWDKRLFISCDGRSEPQEDPIIIKPGKIYKVILMAIESRDVKIR